MWYENIPGSTIVGKNSQSENWFDLILTQRTSHSLTPFCTENSKWRFVHIENMMTIRENAWARMELAHSFVCSCHYCQFSSEYHVNSLSGEKCHMDMLTQTHSSTRHHFLIRWFAFAPSIRHWAIWYYIIADDDDDSIDALIIAEILSGHIKMMMLPDIIYNSCEIQAL